MSLFPSGPDAVLDRISLGRRPWPVLIVLCLLLWLPGFFTLPPGDRDESRFAQATKQMLETGDAVQIRNGLAARNQKPIGIYWLQLPFAAAARAAGLARRNPIWPYRLPSLLGGIFAVLATYGFGRRLVGARAALLGAMLLAGSVILTVEVHVAKTDAALLAATTLAMGILARAYLDPLQQDLPELGLPGALLFWAALGAGILIKGPITPMVVGLATASLAIAAWRRGPPRWLLALRPKTGIWLLLAIVLPWFIAIGLATHGRFFAQSVAGDLGNKLAGSDDAHGGPPALHLLLMPLLFFAGGVAALAAVPGIWRDRRTPAVRFLAAWLVPSWVMFEMVATKLPHYTLPLYPALALLAGRWLAVGGIGHNRVAATVGMTVAGILGVAALVLPEVALPGVHAIDLLGLPVFTVAALLVWRLWRVWPDGRRSALLMLCATPFLNAGLFGLELPGLTPLWIAPRVQAALVAHWPHGRPASAGFGELGFAEPSLMFLCGTDTQLFGKADDAVRFLASGRDHVLVVGDRDLATLRQAAAAKGVATTAFATVDGYNYSRGRRVTLSLIAAGG